MRKTIFLGALVLVCLVLTLFTLVNLQAVPASEMPTPDPALLITLPDGEEVALGELIEREVRLLAAQREASATRTATVVQGPPAEATMHVELQPDEGRAGPFTEEELRDPAFFEKLVQGHRNDLHEMAQAGDLYALAELSRDDGDLDQALSLYLSVPLDHPQYARAQRRIAWNVFTEGKGQPERGIAFANAALLAEPFNDNSWQDLARVYGSSLGFDVD